MTSLNTKFHGSTTRIHHTKYLNYSVTSTKIEDGPYNVSTKNHLSKTPLTRNDLHILHNNLSLTKSPSFRRAARAFR